MVQGGYLTLSVGFPFGFDEPLTHGVAVTEDGTVLDGFASIYGKTVFFTEHRP